EPRSPNVLHVVAFALPFDAHGTSPSGRGNAPSPRRRAAERRAVYHAAPKGRSRRAASSDLYSLSEARGRPSMLKGFRDFFARGNVVDLAVGVIIGAAFSGIVDSLVKDIVTPILGLLGGQPDFSAFKAGPVGIGTFVNAVLSFLIKAAGLYFLIILPFNKIAARLPAAAPPPPQTEVLLTEIRDLLKKRPA